MTNSHLHIKSKTNWLMLLALVVTALTGTLSIGESYSFPQPKVTSGLVVSENDQVNRGVSLFTISQHQTTALEAPACSNFKTAIAVYAQQIRTRLINYDRPSVFQKMTYSLPVKTIPQSSDEDISSLIG